MVYVRQYFQQQSLFPIITMERMHIHYCTNTEDHLLTSLSSTRLKYGKQNLNIDSFGTLSIFSALNIC